MRVGNALGSIPKCELEHGGTYSDPIKKIPRQFDFRATISSGNRIIRLAVECKNLAPECPLVVCGTARSPAESRHGYITARPRNFYDGKEYCDSESFITKHFAANESIYRPGEFVGKSTVRIVTKARGQPAERQEVSSDSDVYESWAQAISSADGLCQRATAFPQVGRQTLFHTVVIPIVVVSDNSLWTMQYDHQGAVSAAPSQVAGCTFYVDHRVGLRRNIAGGYEWGLDISHIHFLTMSGLVTLTKQLSASGTAERPDGLSDVGLWGKWFPKVSPEFF